MNRFFRTLAAAALLLASPASLSAASRDIEFNDAAGKAWPTVNHAQASAAGARPADQRLRPALDFDSLIRNPATGWMLYDDALGDVAKADEYWQAMDEATRKHASIFYLRWRWAEAEPEEGRYAWLYDPNFTALIEGARQRNLRLAFRFYVNSQSNLRQATPDYVRRAGAEGLMETGQRGPLWTPYADDPVFQKKLSTFVAAFAKEFDDPARVDFVDALGLGWWGEGHHIPFKNATNIDQTLRWILDTLIARFLREGGYRVAPVEVRHPQRLKVGEEFLIDHAWVNLGVGVMPNLNKRWGGKYRPAMALIPPGQREPGPNAWIDSRAEPGEWLRGSVHAYALCGRLDPATKPGTYTLVCAILNTRRDGGPDIQLALRTPRFGSWYELGRVEVVP